MSSPDHYSVNWYGENSYRACLDLIRLSGLTHVRERLSWSEVSSAPGKYDWGRYLENANMSRERGLTLSGVFHDAPKYARRGGTGVVEPKAVYRFCHDVCKTFGAAMGDWEFWNEPDISFWPEPAWDFMSAMKAASLGFRSANPEVTVLNGAMAYLLKGNMSEVLFENDLAKYTDVLNIHSYSPPSGWAGHFADLHAFQERFGMSGRQMWFTESSTNMEGESEADGLEPGFKAHSYEQELLVAELYAKNNVYLQMQGLARNYFFVFGAYNERGGKKDWGVQRRDGSVKLVYSAMSAMTEHLAAARIEGEKRIGEGLRCFVFRHPDGMQSAVYWSESPVDTAKGETAWVLDRQMQNLDRPFAFPAADGSYPSANWCGTRRTVTAKDGKLELVASRYVTYLDGLHGVSVDIPAHPAGKVQRYVPGADEDLSVVFGIDFSRDDFLTTKAEASTEGDGGKVKLRIWNFSEKAKRGRIVVDGCTLEGLPEAVLLPADGAEVSLDATLRMHDATGDVARLVVTGVFDERKTSRLVVPIHSDKRLLETCYATPLAADEVAFWTRNDSADETKISWDEREKAVRFDLTWKDPKKDRWFYPKHVFRNRADSLDGATHLDCEVKMVSNKVENDVLCSHCMLFKDGGETRYCDFKPPTEKWERRRIVLTDSDGITLADGKDSFGLGFNPHATQVTYWIRNMRVFKKRAKDVSVSPGTYYVPESGTANVVDQAKPPPNAKTCRTVVFVGGSITEMHGFRPRVMASLRARYPDVEFKEVASGISSTCSDTGAFRIEEDVLSRCSPDLLVVEAAVNDDQDGGFDERHCIRGMEGMLRRVRREVPTCAQVVGLMVNRSQYDQLMKGEVPLTYAAHRKVAERYGAAVADVGTALVASAKAGGMTWAEYGDCHPSPAGCGLGAEVVLKAVDKVFDPRRVGKSQPMPTPLDPLSYAGGVTVLMQNVLPSEGWHVSRPDWSSLAGQQRQQFTQGDALWSDRPGAEFRFRFSGTAVGAILTAGPDVGDLDVSIDGEGWRRIALVTPYSQVLHYPYTKLFADDLTAGEHELRMRVRETTHPWGVGRVVRIHRLVVNGSY